MPTNATVSTATKTAINMHVSAIFPVRDPDNAAIKPISHAINGKIICYLL
jgi:hypothetical protein